MRNIVDDMKLAEKKLEEIWRDEVWRLCEKLRASEIILSFLSTATFTFFHSWKTQ